MYKKTSIYQIIIIFTLILLSLTGCSKMKKSNEIVIGVAWPFEANKDLFSEGIDLAVKEINSSGGIEGRELRLLKKDDRSEVALGMTIAQSFAEDREIQAVIGHFNSFISIPTSTIYDNAGLVMLSPSSTAPELTKKGYKNIFRNIPSDEEIAKQLAIYLSEEGYRRMVIYYSDDSYGNGLANAFEDYAKSQGISIVDRFNYYTSLEDLRRLNKRWQAFGADGIFIASNVSLGGQFIFDARQGGINLPFFGGNSLDSLRVSEIGGNAAEGIIIGSIFNPYAEGSERDRFVKSFVKEYNKMPTSYSALGYDSVKLLSAAIARSDLDDPSTVAEELRNLGKWQGAIGSHEFDKNGDDIGDLVVLKRMRNGVFQYVER